MNAVQFHNPTWKPATVTVVHDWRMEDIVVRPRSRFTVFAKGPIFSHRMPAGCRERVLPNSKPT